MKLPYDRVKFRGGLGGRGGCLCFKILVLEDLLIIQVPSQIQL